MKYRNISSGIVPVAGFQILPGREVELTEKQLANPQVKPYLHPNYLVPVIEAEPQPKVVEAPVRQELPKNLQLDGMPESKGVTVVPQVSTEAELEAAQAKEDSEKTVAVPTAAKDKETGAAIQTIVEVSVDKIKSTIEELKAIASWKKRNEFVTTITDLPLLQALVSEVSGKVKEAVEAQIEELQKKK